MTTVDTLGQHALQVGQAAIDAFNDRDWPRFRGAVAPDFVFENEDELRLEGADNFVAAVNSGGWLGAVPDIRATTRRSIVCGDTAVFEVIWEGIHSGPLEEPGATFPATGNRVRAQAALVMRVQDNKVSEMRQYLNSMTFLKQMGAIHTPG